MTRDHAPSRDRTGRRTSSMALVLPTTCNRAHAIAHYIALEKDAPISRPSQAAVGRAYRRHSADRGCPAALKLGWRPHPVAQWQAHIEKIVEGHTPDDQGRYVVQKDGLVSAYMTLAYDLFVVRNNIPFQERIVERLRRREHFAGVRYELLVAAIFARAGFQVDPDDESGLSKSPDFVVPEFEGTA